MRLNRLDHVTVEATAKSGVVSRIYANPEIHLEASALEEAEAFSSIDGLKHLSFTPDFHKGAGTPIGTTALIDRIYPSVTGNDIGCGMKLDVLKDIKDIVVTDELIVSLREAFFSGKREVHIENRHDLLAYGLEAKVYGYSTDRIPVIKNAHQGGSLGDGTVSHVLKSFLDIDSTRDNFLGTIGGGNHFVEIQQIDEIIDTKSAYHYGMSAGKYCVMCHSGSLDLGHAVGNYFNDKARELWKGKYPENGFFYLPDELGLQYVYASYNAANFASMNRAVMASMVAHIVKSDLQSVYDSPHNLVWIDTNGYLHRKGSCPADADELVIIPGSMGTRSLLAIGKGFAGTLNSSPHGAGRVLNRNAARKTDLDQKIKVITKIDFSKTREDVSKEVRKHLAEEAPSTYKDITQIAATVDDANIARPIAWLKPILTLKG